VFEDQRRIAANRHRVAGGAVAMGADPGGTAADRPCIGDRIAGHNDTTAAIAAGIAVAALTPGNDAMIVNRTGGGADPARTADAVRVAAAAAAMSTGQLAGIVQSPVDRNPNAAEAAGNRVVQPAIAGTAMATDDNPGIRDVTVSFDRAVTAKTAVMPGAGATKDLAAVGESRKRVHATAAAVVVQHPAAGAAADDGAGVDQPANVEHHAGDVGIFIMVVGCGAMVVTALDQPGIDQRRIDDLGADRLHPGTDGAAVVEYRLVFHIKTEPAVIIGKFTAITAADLAGIIAGRAGPRNIYPPAAIAGAAAAKDGAGIDENAREIADAVATIVMRGGAAGYISLVDEFGAGSDIHPIATDAVSGAGAAAVDAAGIGKTDADGGDIDADAAVAVAVATCWASAAGDAAGIGYFGPSGSLDAVGAGQTDGAADSADRTQDQTVIRHPGAADAEGNI
jgi:hypothetical protein